MGRGRKKKAEFAGFKIVLGDFWITFD